MSAAHTPGPWNIERRDGDEHKYVPALLITSGTQNPNGGDIAEVRLLSLPYFVNSKIEEAALNAEREANARLIAAAPELLAALAPFAEWLKHPVVPVMAAIRPEEWAKVREVYAKVRAS